MSQKVKKRGGRVSTGNQIVHNSKCGLFDKRGRPYFHFFPQMFSWTKKWIFSKWFLGNFKRFKLMFFFFLGVFPKFKIFPISNFSQIRSEGGGHKIFNFSQIQKSPKHPGGGGQENCGLFPLFGTFFNSMAPLKV